MVRQVAANVENNFVRGLITETTALNFPENACTEMDNCTITDTGKITRRLPFDIESGAEASFLPNEPGAVISYRWESVSGSGTINFLVVQKGGVLFFFDVSDPSVPVSNSKLNFEVELSSYVVEGSTHDPKDYPCQFAVSDGNLIVVNRAIDPIYVKYNPDTQEFSVAPIEIKIRDFKGLDDGLGLHERFSGSIDDLKTDNPEHYYNLFNQGWFITNFLTEWDSARSDLPSNADYYWLYRGTDDKFDGDLVGVYNPGNRPAPKGHAILNAFQPDRNAAMDAEGVATVSFRRLFDIPLDVSGYSTIAANFNTSTANAFDGNKNQDRNSCARTSSLIGNGSSTYIGKALGSPAVIKGATFWGPNDGPIARDYSFVENRPTMRFILRAKQGSAPTSASDGTRLGSWLISWSAYSGSTKHNQPRTIPSNDSVTEWDYVWIQVEISNCPFGCRLNLAEIEFITIGSEEPPPEIETVERPQCVESYAGRVFYTGVEAPGFNNNIYFSQIIEDPSQYGLCYQKNDPTSEDISDLLADDGGVIRIPEMGQVVKLFKMYSVLLVFATNGIWTITGGVEGSFKANEYAVQKVSDIGIQSPFSFVSVRGVPVWWAEDGIYTIQFDPNYNSVSVLNLTDQTIRSFILQIPTLNRKFVKGAYDAAESRIIWVFNDDADLQEPDYHKYNRVLCYNALTQSFFPYTIDISDVAIRDVVSVNYSELDGTVRFLLTYDVPGNENQEGALFGMQRMVDGYKDWVDFGSTKSYDSWFITGYKIHGDAYRKFQTNYVWVFLDHEEGSSCWVQSLFDFTNNPNSGRWSTPQQCFNPNLAHRNVNYRRLKLRGTGKAVQLKFYSEDDKPMSIVGFALWETMNAAP